MQNVGVKLGLWFAQSQCLSSEDAWIRPLDRKKKTCLSTIDNVKAEEIICKGFLNIYRVFQNKFPSLEK